LVDGFPFLPRYKANRTSIALNKSFFFSASRESPIRVSQSGALDTQSEPALPIATGTAAAAPDLLLTERSEAFENLYELSIQGLEDDDDEDDEDDGTDIVSTPEPLQNVYRRIIKETEQQCQERALAEKEILYKRIDELESMLLAARSAKTNCE